MPLQINQLKPSVRTIAYILAIHFAVCSTQPLWQPLKQALFGSCGGSSCSMVAMSCAASPTLPGSPVDDGDDQTPDGCCVPFHCCFPCCCYCVQPEQFADFAKGKKNTRPNEETKTLHSVGIGEHFQPPEIAGLS